MIIIHSMTNDLKFIGQNIRFLRRSKNLTLFQLSKKIGIQEGPLGRIERGINLPSAAVIYNLTKALGVSAEALFSKDNTPTRPAPGDNTFFVALAPHSPPPKNLISACHDIMDVFHALEDICTVPKKATLPLSLSFEPDYPGMDRMAERVRTYMGMGDAVVFDYFELFENFGLRIILFPFQRAAAELDAVSFYEPACHNAFFFLNARKNPEKQLYSLGIELGKILIFNQMQLNRATLFPDYPETKGKRPINTERAPKRFASTFLMPEKAVLATVSQLGIFPDTWSWELLLRIKHRFGISAEAFLYRLLELNCISTDLAEKFQNQIRSFYNQTNYAEPDKSRRCLTPNGRFFDLLMTAERIASSSNEINKIKDFIKKYNIVKV